MCSIAMLAYNGLMGTEYTPSGTAHFTDTNDPDVNAAYELKIVQGYGDGRFGPNDTLTREQFFKISCNFMQTVGYPTEQNPRVNRYSLSEFSDLKQLAEWAKTPTRLLCYIGAVKGSDGKLLPQSSTSSLEALVIFLRCYKFTTSWDGTIEQPSLADDLVAYALTFEGYDYVYGGTTPAGFDCSGFVQYVYRHFGFNITRTATSQYYNDGEHVSRSELMPGDLVFFGSGGEITHVGIYIGGGRFITRPIRARASSSAPLSEAITMPATSARTASFSSDPFIHTEQARWKQRACQLVKKVPSGLFSSSCFPNCKIKVCSMILQFCRCGGLFDAKGHPDGFLSHFPSLRNFRLSMFFRQSGRHVGNSVPVFLLYCGKFEEKYFAYPLDKIQNGGIMGSKEVSTLQLRVLKRLRRMRRMLLETPRRNSPPERRMRL